MRVAFFTVSLCVLVHFTYCGLIQTDLRNGSDESNSSDYSLVSKSEFRRDALESEQLSRSDLQSDSDESRYYGATVTEKNVESFEVNSELGDEVDQEPAPKTSKKNNKRRPKKSLSKKKVKRFARARYLEDKLKTLVERNPALKKKITDKLAERERKSLKKSKNVVSLVGPDGAEEIAFNENQVDVYELPINNVKVYEGPSFVTETEAVAVETANGDVIMETLEVNPIYSIGASSDFENTVPCGAAYETAYESARPKVYSRSIYDPVHHEMITFLKNSGSDGVNTSPEQIVSAEIVPCTELETLTSSGIVSPQSNEDIVFTTGIVSEGYQYANTFEAAGFEPRTFFSAIQNNQAIEPLNLSAEDKEEAVHMKFKKNIASDQWPLEISNYLQLDPSFELTPDYLIGQAELTDGSTHYWAPLEPVKTYEIKQINIDEEAIIQEIKNVLGDVDGPIIIGEPGEPVIVKHYAKPYVIEYYERPIVVEHHQQAALNVYTQPPVVIDHYEPLIFNEIEGEPVVVVEEVCPVIQEVCPVVEEIVLS